MSLKNVGVPVVAYNKIMAYREKIKREEGYYLSAGAVVAKALFAYLEQNNIKLDEEGV